MSITLIPVTDCCLQLGIEETFIMSLEERGLTRIVRNAQSLFIEERELRQLEKMARLYNELSINIEGIEAVVHLLERIEKLEAELLSLSNRLRLYE